MTAAEEAVEDAAADAAWAEWESARAARTPEYLQAIKAEEAGAKALECARVRAAAWVRRWEWAQAVAEVREEGYAAARAAARTAEEGK